MADNRFAVGGFASGLSRGLRTGMELDRSMRESRDWRDKKAQEEAYKEARKGIPAQETLNQIPEVSGENFVGPLPEGQTEPPKWNPYDRLEAQRAQILGNAKVSDEQREKLLADLDRVAVTGATQKIYQGEMARKANPEAAIAAFNEAAQYLGPDVGGVFSLSEDGKIMVGSEEFTPQMSAQMAMAAKDPTAALVQAQEWLFKDRQVTNEEERTDIAGENAETNRQAVLNQNAQFNARLQQDEAQFTRQLSENLRQFNEENARRWFDSLTDEQYKSAMVELEALTADGSLLDAKDTRDIEAAVNELFEDNFTGAAALIGEDADSQKLYNLLAGNDRIATMSKGLISEMMIATNGMMTAPMAALALTHIYQGLLPDGETDYATTVNTETGVVSVKRISDGEEVLSPIRIRPSAARMISNLGTLGLAPRGIPAQQE